MWLFYFINANKITAPNVPLVDLSNDTSLSTGATTEIMKENARLAEEEKKAKEEEMKKQLEEQNRILNTPTSNNTVSK